MKNSQTEISAVQQAIARQVRRDYLVEQPGHANVVMKLITAEEAERIRRGFFGAVVTMIG